MALAGFRILLFSVLFGEASLRALGQFGGDFGGGGGFGGGGYTPPAPLCPAFKCGPGEKSVGRPDYQVWSYGCADSGMNILNAGSFDPSKPFGNQMGNKNIDKCCVDKDICKQTCGMTSKACHDNFQKCTQKICKGDQNCQLQAMMADITAEPYEEEEKNKDYKYDPEESKCRAYKRGQNASCMCVHDNDWKSATEESLKNFYGRFNPEKLDKQGEIKDVAEVWKKWSGKEPDMFMALTTKYKSKAVERRAKPKPPPYKPPPSNDDPYDATENGDYVGGDVPTPAPKPPPAPALDDEDEAYQKERRKLETLKREAAEDEDYDKADQAKSDLEALRATEMDRLKAIKVQAIEAEDYLEAKRVKSRIAALEEL